jgi:2-polyprenyl-3-methyl-5-hydroxy-6-metoxy-1,4-benzoquinol methylase
MISFTRFSSTFPARDPAARARQGRSFHIFPPLPPGASVLDVGCGSGTQTRDLARLTTGTITAVDNHQPFLDAVSKKAKEDGTAGFPHHLIPTTILKYPYILPEHT